MANPFETMERLVRRRTRHLQFAEKTGELNIVPYLDIMVNLIMFMLVTITTSVSLSVLGVSTPKYNQQLGAQPQTPPKPELQLTVVISLKGFYLQARQQYVGADGQTLPKGAPKPETPTVVKRGDEYDFARLTEIVARFKQEAPTESRVILIADYRVPYDTLVKTMDALRNQGAKELFPDVFLGTL
jgi:biopolymer transport protein ExbD